MDSPPQCLVRTDSSTSMITTSETPTTFPLFSSFPVEIQCKIFKEALPDSQLVYWNFLNVETFDFGPPPQYTHQLHYHRVLSFLLACKKSKDEVFRNYAKLNIDLATRRALGERMFDSDAYFRPAVDALCIKFQDFEEIYQLGGKLSLENVTHLVLDNVFFGFGHDYVGEEHHRTMARQVKLYTLISIHCPALKKLNLVQGGRWIGDRPDGLDGAEHFKLIDVTEGASDFSWNTERYRQWRWSRFTERGAARGSADLANMIAEDNRNLAWLRRELNHTTRKMLRDFDRFLNAKEGSQKEGDSWAMPSKKTLRYWQNLRPVPSILVGCWNHNKASPCSCSSDTPEVYYNRFRQYLAIHKDGTPLNMYKGLAQIFEGAPW